MQGQDFKRWRLEAGLTQLQIAARLKVTRSTIQNWERGVTDVPESVSLSCTLLERRIHQENPGFGPLTLVYSNLPLFVDAGGLRCLPATIQRESYRTNTVALARVQQLWGRRTFQSPIIIDASQAIIWNAIELERVVFGKDPDAPTLVNLLKTVAQHLRADCLDHVAAAPRRLSTTASEERKNAIEEQAKALDQLAHAGFHGILGNPSKIEGICLNLLALGSDISGGPASNVAQALVILKPGAAVIELVGN